MQRQRLCEILCRRFAIDFMVWQGPVIDYGQRGNEKWEGGTLSVIPTKRRGAEGGGRNCFVYFQHVHLEF